MGSRVPSHASISENLINNSSNWIQDQDTVTVHFFQTAFDGTLDRCALFLPKCQD